MRLGYCYGGIAYYGEIVPLDFRDVSRSRREVGRN
jgi:hypothetical protein